MPPEGQKNSEELLKRYAKERQEQAPNLPLHPATRRLLQGEVTRQFGKKSESRGWSAWLGIMRGRLAIGTALGAVVVTGVCIWWNNEKPQPMDLAKAERTETELALPSRSRSDELKLKVEKPIAAVDAPSRVQFEDKARRAPGAPVERAIRPDLKVAQPSDASVSTVTEGRVLALNEPMATTSTFSFQSSLARGLGKSGDLGFGLGGTATEWTRVTNTAHLAGVEFDGAALSSSVSRTWFAATTTGLKNATNGTDLALAYALPGSDPSSVASAGSLPSAAISLDDNERKDAAKLSGTAKLAEGLTVALAPNGGMANLSTRARLEPQAPMAQAPATTAQPQRSLGERATATLRGRLVTQAATAPERDEAAARHYRQSALTADAAASKQKTLRDLERLEAEPAVLNRFVIEQQGNSVRVVDADGSVYDGKVEEPVATAFDSDLYETYAEKKDQLAREKPVALQGAPAPRTEGYSFRASGSNVTLRQMVVVNGRFSPAADNVRLGAAGGAGAASSSSATAPAPTFKSGTGSNRANGGGQQPGFGGRYGYTTNQPATIEGTVRIGVTNQQWFRAVRNPR